MSYSKFKKEVLARDNFQCVCCGTYDALTVHHILKRSLYPHLVEVVDNGVTLCGSCHSELERRLRCGEDTSDILSSSVIERAEKLK